MLNEKFTREILKACGLTEHDIKKHMKDGVFIYTLSEYVEEVNSNDNFDDEEKEELIAAATTGRGLGSMDKVTVNGVDYIVDYVL